MIPHAYAAPFFLCSVLHTWRARFVWSQNAPRIQSAGSTPAELVNRWGAATLDHYLQLYMSHEARDAGVMLTSAYQVG